MSVSLKIRPEYAELYGVSTGELPLPEAGESLRDYVGRAKLGKEEDILAVVNGRAKPWSYRLLDSDCVEIYPMAAAG